MIKAVLLDFDGTIADTFEIVVRGANATLKEAGYPEIVDPESFRDHSAFYVFKEMKIPFWKLPIMERKIRARIANEMQEADVFSGIAAVISQLRKHYSVGIVTSNGRDSVDAVLRKRKISVDLLHTESSIFGKGTDIKRVCKEQGWAPQEVIYIGDELRDIDAARQARVRIVSVTWGYNSKSALKKAKPDALANTMVQLAAAIKKLDKN